jgi:NADH-quinone oxidoreductase subunit L
MSMNEITANATWAAPFVGAAVMLLLAIAKKDRFRSTISVGALLVSVVSATFLLNDVLSSSQGVVQFAYPWVSTLNVEFAVYVDTLAAFMVFIVAWLCLLIGVYSSKYMEGDSGMSRYWFFFSFFTGSMLLIVMSGNLLLTFIGWEGTGLASYALIGHWFTDDKKNWVGDPGRKALGISMEFAPSHSGVRALIFTRLGDVGLIAGIAVIYTLTHSLSIPDMANNVQTWGNALAVRGILLPFLLFFSLGAFAKSAQFPFHEWLVTAMTGPTSVSALIHAATMVKAGVFFMLRFTPIIFLIMREATDANLVPIVTSQVSLYFTIVVYIGAFTAFFMATQAIVARELKLVLAFSTASQLGYMFMAVGSAGLIPEFANGLVASFSHLIGHGIFKAALFLSAGAVIHAVESRFMDDMGGLSKYMKFTFIATLIPALSLAGVPPLMGFWTKDNVLEVVYESGLLIPLALAIVTAALTAFYSARFVFKTFRVQPSERVLHMAEKHELHETPHLMLIPYAVLASATLALGVAWLFVGGDFYAALTKNVLGLIEKPLAFQVELNPVLTVLSVGMVSIGLIAAYLLYGKSRFDRKVAQRLGTSRSAVAIRNFLYDRWYLNPVYYRVFVSGGSRLSRGLFKWLDTNVIDGFYHRFIPWFTIKTFSGGFKFLETGIIDRVYNSTIVKAFETASASTFKFFETSVIDRGYNALVAKAALSISNTFRKVQTGRVNHYLLAFLFGFVILLIMFLLGVI